MTPVEMLIQIAEHPQPDSKVDSRTAIEMEKAGLVARCEGWNIITAYGKVLISLLQLRPKP